jgi:hypothetical protein
MKLTLSIVLTIVWFIVVFFGVGLAVHALDTPAKSSGFLPALDALEAYQASVARWDTITWITLALCPVGALAIVFLVYGRPTRGARIFVLLTAATVVAIQLYDIACGNNPGLGTSASNHRHLLKIVVVICVGLFALGALFWAVGEAKSAEKREPASPGGQPETNQLRW